DEIADLLAVAVDLNLAVFDDLADEPGEESLSIVFEQVSRTIDFVHPQRARANAEHRVGYEVIVLACRLVDAVAGGGSHEVRLADRQRLGTSVDLTRAGKHDFELGVIGAAPLGAA